VFPCKALKLDGKEPLFKADISEVVQGGQGGQGGHRQEQVQADLHCSSPLASPPGCIMGILGIGIDLVYLPRFTSFVTRRTPARVAQRILSTSELVAFRQLPFDDAARVTRFLAVRWAVKEATYKALYPAANPTWGMVSYKGVDLTMMAKPSLVLAPELAKTAGAGRTHVSVSHDGDYVFAQVIVEEKRDL
jgi:holo-[acyl-carrier protein] synthase